MLIKSFASILFVTSSFVFVFGQTQDTKDQGSDKTAKPASSPQRQLPFPSGVDLQFLIKELARDMDINVLFDIESFRAPRRTTIDLRNVTAAEALNYLLLQEGLFSEEVGPRTIMVATHARRPNGIPQIGVGVFYLTDQLEQYFGVEHGILINNILPNSPAAKVGLKAGDVIVEMDGLPVTGAFGLFNAINDKREGDITFKIVRDRKSLMFSVTPQRKIE
jgi:membrane-associated protease RseP (regulator of RpoE activity)